MKKFFTIIVAFSLSFALVFFGFQFFTKTGIFKIPGVVVYDESLSEKEVDFLKPFFPEEKILDYDVKISAITSSTSSAPENSLLFDILVPVTDFYDPRNSISATEAEPLLASINNLDSAQKLLAIDNNYYLDTFDTGAFYRYFEFESKEPSEAMEIIRPNLPTFPSKEDILSFAQTGVTALSRGMYLKLESTKNAAYFAEDIKDFLSSKDLTHISNEASFTDLANSRNICSDWRMLDVITAIGTDIVELTGNHNQDCGDQPARDSIDKYTELGIKVVGGGKTATEAAFPLQISEKNTNLTILAYNYSTGGYTLDNTPGANFYTEEKFNADIAAAKEHSDFIVVDIQFNECANYDWETEYTACDSADSSAARDGYTQSSFFKHLIDSGADMVVGTSAHQPQTYELYKEKPIYYGLGNLFFDQIWWPGTTRSLIVTSYFNNGKLIQNRLTPTVYDATMQTKLMDEEDSRWFIERLNAAR